MPTSFLVSDSTDTPFVSGSSGLSIVRATATPYDGSPIGAVAGVVGNLVMNTSNNTLFLCTVAGTSGQAQWEQVLVDPSLFALLAQANVFTDGQAINVADTFSGDLLSMAVGTSGIFSLDEGGNLVLSGNVSASGGVSADGQILTTDDNMAFRNTQNITALPANYDGNQSYTIYNEGAIAGITFSGTDNRLLAIGMGPNGPMIRAAANDLDLTQNNQVLVPNATASDAALALNQVQTGGVVQTGGLANGSVTGPKLANATITESNLAGGSVHQGQLSTATASGSTGIGVNASSATYSLTGGIFSWYTWSAYAAGSTAYVSAYWATLAGGDLGSGQLVFINLTGGAFTNTAYVKENYINSSPPYTEGPLFVYMGFNKAGERTHICVAPDPTWAHHGPTILIPHFKKGDLGYRNIRMVDDVPCSVIARDVKHPLFKRYLAGDTHEVPVPIDLKYKDSDRDLEPHPWHHTPSDTQFCLLEPGSDLMIDLHQIYQDSDADNVRKIVEDYVKVGAVTDKNAPKGMVIRRAQWRNT